MARLFDSASLQSLNIDPWSAITAPPFTISAWLYVTSDLHAHFAGSIADKDATHYHALYLDHTTMAAKARTFDGVVRDATTTNFWAANAWHHIVGIWGATNSRRIILDGDIGNAVTDVNNAVVANVDQITIAVSADSTPFGYVTGRVAEVAWYDVALTDAEGVILADAYSALFVRPQSLIAYHPCIGRLSPEIDPVGGFDMALVNGPTQADHPRIIYPSAAHMRMIAAVSGLAWPIFSQQGIHSAVFGGQVIR